MSLCPAERPRATASRIRGRPALVRRLRALLLAVSRYARGRAVTPEDVTWAACTLDALADCLRVADGLPAPPATGHPGPLPHDAPRPQPRGGR